MTLAMNVMMMMFTTLSFTFAISYFIREKEIGTIRWFIFLMGIFCGLNNFGYAMMSLTEISKFTLFYRNMGMISLNAFLYAEFILVCSENKLKKWAKALCLVPLGVILVLTTILHSLPGDVTFITDDGFTSFINNHLIGYKLESAFVVVLFVIIFPLGIRWMVIQPLRRGRIFVLLLIFANFFYLFSSFPYFMGKETAHPAFLYCLGCFVAYGFIWAAGIIFSGFNITAQSLSGEIFGDLNAGLLIFDDAGELIMRNEFARNELRIHNVSKQKLSDIFDISRVDSFDIISEVIEKKSAQRTLHVASKNETYLVNFKLKEDSFGDPLCIISVVNDITKQEMMMEQVMLANKAKSDFLASMSHEIRTPINAVLGMNEMIIRESNQREIIDYALDVESSGRMLLSLINDILDFSKIESGKMEIVPVKYDVPSLLNDIYNMLSGRAKEKGLEFAINADSNLPSRLYGDEIRVRQIIINLLTNAIKYTDEGKVELALTYDEVKADLTGNTDKYVMLKIVVKDTGKGIKEEDCLHLFESFTRVDEEDNRHIEGTGLGLSLTKSFTEMMGGSIGVESKYGEGSTFTATIKQKVVDASPIGNLGEKISNQSVEKKTKRTSFTVKDCKILVVDDVAMNCKVVCNLLKNTGIEIDVCNSGQEAIEMCQKNKYDIIYMDHMMPVMDGIECLHILKEMDTPNNETPIVALTANAISGMKEMYLSEGFDDYLSKPINMKSMENSIGKYVDVVAAEN